MHFNTCSFSSPLQGEAAFKRGNAVAYSNRSLRDNIALGSCVPTCLPPKLPAAFAAYLQGDASLKGGNAVEYLTIGVQDNPALASGATYFLFVELVDTKRPATDVMRLKMRTWAGTISITGTSSGLNMSAPTLTPHVNSEGGARFWRM
jgi:hypothetical protein